MASEDAEERPITAAQIRQRAYDLWERNHRPEGFEIQFWLLAERELRAERARRTHQDQPTEAVPDRSGETTG